MELMVFVFELIYKTHPGCMELMVFVFELIYKTR